VVPVGRFFGVPIYFAPSWFIIAILLTIYYGPIVKDAIPSASSSTAYLVAFGYAGLFALCVLAHELGHTGAALLLHTPVRRIVIFLLGGVSEIAQDSQRPRDEFLIAAAGPAVSVALTAATGAGAAFAPPHTVIGVLFVLLFWSNLVVAAFNLLPGLPLDGGRILRAVVWSVARSRLRGTQVAAWAGRGFAVLLGLSGLVIDRSSWGFAAGFITILLAVYLWSGATQALRVGEMLERLPQVSLRDLLRPGLLVPPDLSVAEALRRVWDGNARGLVVVDGAERPQAIVDEALITALPAERRPWTSVAEVSRALEPGLILDVDLAGDDLLTAVRTTPAHEYLVVDHSGRPAGILSVVDLAAQLQAGA
jgi:Zn-dependent protease/CBS domain-containing protein